MELIRAGMDVARLNFSHGEHSFHKETYDAVREASRRAGKPVAILADLCGPKIRVGKFVDGGAELVDGSTVRLTPRAVPGTAALIPHTYAPLARDVKKGEPVLINDGLLRLEVTAKDGADVLCKVVNGGRISDRKGMNLPQTQTSTPALTVKDKKDLAFARKLGVDYVALSFVRCARDIVLTKKLAGSIPVIAKIEKPEAVDDLEAILDAADGAMVARGDLGVEMGHEKVPLVQKRIIRALQPRSKPVITATQMLESMITNYTPTRAEVSDVANAVLDGTGAVMLSGETSVGKFPVHVVETMASIINEVEAAGGGQALHTNPVLKDQSFSSAIAEAVTSAARGFGLKAIAVYTESGRSAELVSAERPSAEIVAFTRHESVRNRLALLWGVHPVHGDWVKGVEGVVEQAERTLLDKGLASAGDRVAITFGMRLGDEPFQTNILKLWTVRRDSRAKLTRTSKLPDGTRP
jgi:pyruvate kinase